MNRSREKRSTRTVKDLHTYLEEARKRYPDQVIDVECEISARFEVTALLLHLHKLSLEELPILIFHRVRTVTGVLSEYPMLINLSGSHRRWLDIIGGDLKDPQAKETQLQELLVSPGPQPIVIPPSEAPVKDCVLQADKVDLFKLPATLNWTLDVGPYIHGGAFLNYDPDTGVDNSTILRGWIKERDLIVWHANLQRHTAYIFDKYEKRGQDMPAAFWVGHHPAVMKGAATHFPYGLSHWGACGIWAGEPIRLTASTTWGEDFLVPADAEFVIEGFAPAGGRLAEGPYGEDQGHYGPQWVRPYFKVTAVTYRAQPIWVNYVTGQAPFLRDRRDGKSHRAIAIHRVAKGVFPGVLDVRAVGPGVHFVRIRKTREGQAKDVGLASLAAIDGSKLVFVFDEDINVFNTEEALWALGTRTQWDRDVSITVNCRGGATDPSVSTEGVTTKAVIDCTRKTPLEKNTIPNDVERKVRLEDYLPGWCLRQNGEPKRLG